jgi:FAD/FMN-containing dehydrogenase
MGIDELIAELTETLGPDLVSTDVAARELASRDYAWLSPILVEDLPDTIADVVVRPRSSEAIGIALAAAHRHRVPVTARGRGTGNYGQAVPLERGLVVDLVDHNRIRSIEGDIADVDAGVTFTQLESAAAAHGMEVAVMPSMVGSTIGGFLAGGNQGIGSIEHGSIWDGWVTGLDVVGCNDTGEVFSVEGDDIGSYLHSYGTAGVLAGARLRLAPRRERTVVFAAFTSFDDAAIAGRALMDLEPPPRVISVDDPELGPSLPRHRGVVQGAAMLRFAITLDTEPAARAVIAEHGGTVSAVDATAMSSLYSSIYNHSTLRAKRLEPRTCALQVRGWAVVEHGEAVRAILPKSRVHLDGNAPKQHGKGYSGLLLSSWVDRATLADGIDRLRALGVQVISPHTWVLGGHGNVERIRAVTPTVDPDGLLNPGKLPAT